MDSPQTVLLALGRPAEAVRSRAASEASDGEPVLIERARTDRAAFAELYRRHYAAIGSYLLRRSGDVHATEDMLSEVFLSALRGIRKYKSRGAPFQHWLYRIATNVANKWARKHRVRFEHIDEQPDIADARELEHTESGVDPRVQRAVLALAVKHQAVLMLHYVEGLGIDEVAHVLGCRPGTVKSRLSRARDALAARLRTRGES